MHNEPKSSKPLKENSAGNSKVPQSPAEVSSRDVQLEAPQDSREGKVSPLEPNPEFVRPTPDECKEESEAKAGASGSPAKLAANRENAKSSTGPRTDEGKANSSRNSIKHGIYAIKLFSQTKEGAIEQAEYEELGAQLVEHYNPRGFKEELLVEQIFAQLVRQGRILRYEQRVLSEVAVFMGAALEKVLRYSACHSRQLSRLMNELEEEQAKRARETPERKKLD